MKWLNKLINPVEKKIKLWEKFRKIRRTSSFPRQKTKINQKRSKSKTAAKPCSNYPSPFSKDPSSPVTNLFTSKLKTESPKAKSKKCFIKFLPNSTPSTASFIHPSNPSSRPRKTPLSPIYYNFWKKSSSTSKNYKSSNFCTKLKNLSTKNFRPYIKRKSKTSKPSGPENKTSLLN